MKRGKKGLSTIVATLIIILLVFVAVGILWVVLRNFISGGAEQISLGKLTLNMEIEKVQQIDDTNLNVTVKRNAGAGNFTGINFVIYDISGNNNEVVKVTGINMNELDKRTFSLVLGDVNASEISKVEIYPIFTLESGKEVVGDVKDSLEVKPTTSSSSEEQCTDTCSSLSYECGTQSVCGINTNCGNCNSGEICSAGQCIVQSLCGNSVINPGEQCDSSNLNGATCASVMGSGYTGTLTCSASCTFVTSACVAPQQGTVDVTNMNGLVSWWKLNGNFNDATGTYNAQQGGTVTSVSDGHFGQAYQMGSGGYIRTTSSVGQDTRFRGDLTYSFWVRRNGAPTGTTRILGGIALGTAITTGGMAMGYFPTSGYVYIDEYNSTVRSAGVATASNYNLFDNSWHHVVLSRNTLGGSFMYIDNVLAVSSPTTIATGNLAWCPSDSFVFGSSYSGCGSITTTQNFNGGQIDEFMIFNRQLTTTEIQSLYSATSYI